jgi:paraquat-inducible protein B
MYVRPDGDGRCDDNWEHYVRPGVTSRIFEFYKTNKAQFHEDLKKEYKRLYLLERFNTEVITDIYKLINENNQVHLRDLNDGVSRVNKFIDSTTTTHQIINEKIQESNDAIKTLIFNTIQTLTVVNHDNYSQTNKTINDLHEKFQDLNSKLQESNNTIKTIVLDHETCIGTTNKELQALESKLQESNNTIQTHIVAYDSYVRVTNKKIQDLESNLFVRNILLYASIILTWCVFIQQYIYM